MINLFNEDCLETLKRIEDNTIDLCLTDLPYGMLTNKKEADYQNENRNFCDWDFEIDYDKVLPQLKRVMKKDGNVLLFAKSPFTFRLYEQMIKHGFTFRYNWIWKKNSMANFAAMKYRPGNNYEEVMVFTSTPNRGKYFAHAEFNDEIKVKCKFYNYETRTPITSEEVFDKYLIPYVLGISFNKDVRISRNDADAAASNTCSGVIKLKTIFNEDIRIPNMGSGGNKLFSTNSTTSTTGIQLKKIFNEDIRLQTIGSKNWIALGARGERGEGKPVDLFEDIGICSHIHGDKLPSANVSITKIKLNQIFKEKYRDQFEIDLENKILYRTVKSYKNFPASIIDIKYSNSCDKKYKKHPTTKPVEVLEFLLHHYTEETELVLDMTSGSGSTAVACKNMNRNFIGSEISKVWFDVAQQRLNEIK